MFWDCKKGIAYPANIPITDIVENINLFLVELRNLSSRISGNSNRKDISDGVLVGYESLQFVLVS